MLRLSVAIFALIGLLPTLAAADPVLRWSPADTLINVGDVVTLSVYLDDALPVRTIELYITFDPEVVVAISGGYGALFDGFNNFHAFFEVEPGLWRGYCVVLGAEDWAVGPGELWRFSVEGIGNGVSPLTSTELILLPPGSGDYPGVVLTDGQITVSDPTFVPPYWPSGIELHAHPNPFNPSTTIFYNLPKSGEVTLDVHDLRGRLMQTLWSGFREAGRYQFSWDGRDTQGGTGSSGVYLVRLVTFDGQQRAVKVTLSK